MPLFGEVLRQLREHVGLLKTTMRRRMLANMLRREGIDVLVADFAVVTTTHRNGTTSQKLVGLRCDHASIALMVESLGGVAQR